MNATETAAWVGAVSGLGGLLWNVYTRMTSGPRLKVMATAGVRLMPPKRGDPTFIAVDISNVGTSATTITNALIVARVSWLEVFRRNLPSRALARVTPSSGELMPFKLDVGENWSGWAKHDDRIEKLLEAGKLRCEVRHSWSRRPKRVNIQDSSHQRADSPKDK